MKFPFIHLALLLLVFTNGKSIAQENDFVFYSERAMGWYEAGSYFEWQSTTENNNGAIVNVHYQTFGDPSNPQLLLVHGYPRSSFDYEEMVVYLQDDYYIATLDFPGFGFSDKPQTNYSYLLEDDARLHVGKYLLERVANEYRWLDNLPRSPIPVAYVWGALDPVNPLRIANHVWATYLNEREVESSFWVLPTASHYPQRDRPAELAKIVKLALSGEVPDAEAGDAFMWTWNRQRTEHDAIFVGHSIIGEMQFEGAVEYTPQGYRN